METENKLESLDERLERLEQNVNKLLEGLTKKEINKQNLDDDKGLQGEEKEKLRKEVLEKLGRKQKTQFVSWFENDDVTAVTKFDCSIEKLKKIDSFEVERFLGAIANAERIEIIKLLMEKNCTASEIMEKRNYSTTGKLYHHLNFLTNVGLVKNDNGTYHIRASRAGVILAVLTGAWCFIDKNGA